MEKVGIITLGGMYLMLYEGLNRPIEPRSTIWFSSEISIDCR